MVISEIVLVRLRVLFGSIDHKVQVGHPIEKQFAESDLAVPTEGITVCFEFTGVSFVRWSSPIAWVLTVRLIVVTLFGFVSVWTALYLKLRSTLVGQSENGTTTYSDPQISPSDPRRVVDIPRHPPVLVIYLLSRLVDFYKRGSASPCPNY